MIGGASIIDMMILVIDINKGIQAQTAEVRRPNQGSSGSRSPQRLGSLEPSFPSLNADVLAFLTGLKWLGSKLLGY